MGLVQKVVSDGINLLSVLIQAAMLMGLIALLRVNVIAFSAQARNVYISAADYPAFFRRG